MPFRSSLCAAALLSLIAVVAVRADSRSSSPARRRGRAVYGHRTPGGPAALAAAIVPLMGSGSYLDIRQPPWCYHF